MLESGTYANTSGAGIWPGQVLEHTIEDSEGILVNRFLGTTSRNFATTEPGPRDVTGTLTYHPQDMRAVFWAMGSICDTSGTYSIHTATEIDTEERLNPFVASGTLNPPFSFAIEDSKQATGTGKNFVRTVKGIVPNVVTLSCTQGEKCNVDIDYVAQTVTFSSGTTTALVQQAGRPYLWSDVTLTVGGSVIETAKEVTLEINENVEAPHYLNGSRVISIPFVGNRDYMLSFTMDLNADQGNLLYEDLYKANGSFNVTLDLNADTRSVAGSQHSVFYMSGCRIVNTPSIPSPIEGVNESTFEIVPQVINAQSWDSTSGTSKYNYY